MAKRNIKDYLDVLVDKEGLRTEVTITLTDDTLWKIIAGLMAAGVGIVVVANLAKNIFPNKQLAENNRLLQEVIDGLKG
jgi:hypothetical protein